MVMVRYAIVLASMLSSTVFSLVVRQSWARQSTRCFASTQSSITDIMLQESVAETRKLKDHYYGELTSSTTSEGKIHPKPVIWTCREEASKFVKENVDSILFDCDGVLYRGTDLSPNASETLKKLMEDGKQLFFVTNNAAANQRQMQEKISQMMDCPTLTSDQMVGSTFACSQYLKNNLTPGARVHVIGSQGLCEEIQEAGFVVSGGPNENDPPAMSREQLADYEFPEHPVAAVCVGLDTCFTYRKLAIANVLLQKNPDALLISTNQDSFDLVGGDARHLPGNGCIVKALEHGSRRTAINVGKPSPVLAQLIIQKYTLNPARCLFVGDRLDTDIKFGKDSGMLSVLVMSGVTTADKVIGLGDSGTSEEPIPTFIMPYMGMLA